MNMPTQMPDGRTVALWGFLVLAGVPESNAFKFFSSSMSVPFSLPDLHLEELAHSRHSDGVYLLTD